jgi:hypothetical protein
MLALVALLAFATGLAADPGTGFPSPTTAPPPASINPIRCGITGAGAGGSEAAALANALDKLRAAYYIASYTVTDSRCSEMGTLTFCSVKVSACGASRPDLVP